MAEWQRSFVEFGHHDPDCPVVLSSPHNGTLYPDEVTRAAAVELRQLRALEDGPTHLIGRAACNDGAALIAARFARAFVDLNRGPLELDPQLLDGDRFDAPLELTAKVKAGLGVVPSRLLGRSIYHRPLGALAIERRLQRGYLPYHGRLAQLLRERAQSRGAVLLLDLHSMPAEAAQLDAGRPVDVALGDRYGTSCHATLVDRATAVLEQSGLKVARNRPYAGGFITEHYGRPERGWHAVQIEIRRELFMNAATLRPHGGLAAVAAALARLVAALVPLVAQTVRAGDLEGAGPRDDRDLDFEELLRAAD